VDRRYPDLRLRRGVHEPSGRGARCAGKMARRSVICDLSGGRLPAALARKTDTCSVIRDANGKASAASVFSKRSRPTCWA
jgi:hypothetical protein